MSGVYNMITFHPEYVIDENKRKKAVILPVEKWERLMEDLEELEDIRAYDKATAKKQEAVPFEQAVREIQEEPGD